MPYDITDAKGDIEYIIAILIRKGIITEEEVKGEEKEKEKKPEA